MNGLWHTARIGCESYRVWLTALVLNTPLIFGILMLNVAGDGFKPLTWVYVAGLALGYYGLPLLLAGTVVFLLLLPARSAGKFIGIVILSAIIYYLLIDGLVFRIFKFHLNLFWVEFILADFGSLGLTSSTILSGMGMLAGVVAVEISILRFPRSPESCEKPRVGFPFWQY